VVFIMRLGQGCQDTQGKVIYLFFPFFFSFRVSLTNVALITAPRRVCVICK